MTRFRPNCFCIYDLYRAEKISKKQKLMQTSRELFSLIVNGSIETAEVCAHHY